MNRVVIPNVFAADNSNVVVRSIWLMPLAVCGRHSLEVFCVGVALSMIGAAIFRLYGMGLAIQIAVNGAGFTAMTAIAVLRDRQRTSARPSLDILGIDGAAAGEKASHP